MAYFNWNNRKIWHFLWQQRVGRVRTAPDPPPPLPGENHVFSWIFLSLISETPLEHRSSIWSFHRSIISFVLLNCYGVYFIHLSLELLKHISSFKWQKIYIYFFKYTTFSTLNYLTNWAFTTNYFIHFSDILFGLKSAWNRKYTGIEGQGLNLQCSSSVIRLEEGTFFFFMFRRAGCKTSEDVCDNKHETNMKNQ